MTLNTTHNNVTHNNQIQEYCVVALSMLHLYHVAVNNSDTLQCCAWHGIVMHSIVHPVVVYCMSVTVNVMHHIPRVMHDTQYDTSVSVLHKIGRQTTNAKLLTITYGLLLQVLSVVVKL